MYFIIKKNTQFVKENVKSLNSIKMNLFNPHFMIYVYDTFVVLVQINTNNGSDFFIF